MKYTILLALALASCSREDYQSSAQSFFKDWETRQMRSPDEFLIRKPDGSVWHFDVEIPGPNGIERVESGIQIFPPTNTPVEK